MTKNKLFYILLFSSIGYTLLLLPASFLALTSPFLMKGEISGTISEWVNYISIISFPAIVLTGIFTAWSSYHNDNIRWSLICISLPVINLLLYALTNVF